MEFDQISKYFEVFIDDDEIINVVIVDYEDDAKFHEYGTQFSAKEILKIFERNPEKKHRILFDISFLKKFISIPSSQARKTWVRVLSHEQMERIAVIGSNVTYKVIFNFVISNVISKKGRWFTDREKAVGWLKENSKK